MYLKRLVLFVLATIILGMNICPQALAYSEKSDIKETAYNYDDGSYLIVRVEEINSNQSLFATASTKTFSKTTTYYNSSDVAQCSLTVIASFSIVSGKSVTCTGVSYETSSFDDNWSVENVSTSRNNSSNSQSSGTASGDFIKRVLGVKINTVDVSVTVSCDYNGNYW